MEDNIYDISNLKCSYNQKPDRDSVVLDIERLAIPRGKIVFFVGPSGIGKSTILETLGFMNRTIASVGTFTYDGNDVHDVWSWDDERVSDLRNSNFSFIFQQNNLMPNFSAYENIMTTALFQGSSVDEARVKARKVLEQMQLPIEDRPIQEYSGGQQQRLAFARAIMPDFKVLFGDEPTGNLDVKSADNLMRVLHDAVQQRNATAIIVSHDMKLSVTYADMIVQIQKVRREWRSDEDSFYGEINAKSFYVRNGDEWSHDGVVYTTSELHRKLMEEI